MVKSKSTIRVAYSSKRSRKPRQTSNISGIKCRSPITAVSHRRHDSLTPITQPPVLSKQFPHHPSKNPSSCYRSSQKGPLKLPFIPSHQENPYRRFSIKSNQIIQSPDKILQAVRSDTRTGITQRCRAVRRCRIKQALIHKLPPHNPPPQ